jgi:hypothetical protein
MARKAKRERTLPALPDSAGAFAEDGTLGPELAGWVRAMTQLAATGDERASQALIEACHTSIVGIPIHAFVAGRAVVGRSPRL